MKDAHLWPGIDDSDYIPSSSMLTKAMINAVTHHTEFVYDIASVESIIHSAADPDLMFSERLSWSSMTWKLTVKYSSELEKWGVLIESVFKQPHEEHSHFCSSYDEMFGHLVILAQRHNARD